MKKFFGLVLIAATVVAASVYVNAEGLNFEVCHGNYSGTDLPYRKAVCNSNSDGDGKFALVIYLHGGSSKGNDNAKQMDEKGIDSIANFIVRHHRKAVFVVPQCPADKSWGGQMLNVLKGLVDEQTQDSEMDRNRIYIFGGSMGGTGTWSMLSNYPGLFTAAMPVAGNPGQCIADNVAKTPVFTVMGTADRIMTMQTTADFIDKLYALGDETMFETEEGWSHEMTCIQSYTDQRIGWVMAHIKGEDGVESVRSEKAVCCTEYYALNGCRSDAPHNGIYVVKRLFTDGSLEARLEYFDQ